MTKDQLHKDLSYVDHSRRKRLYYANLVIANPKLLAPLLEILFEVDDKISCRAAWVFEFICGEKLEAIIPYLDTFTENISRVHINATIRPVAKICEYLIKAYYSKEEHTIKKHLTEQHKEKIIEACFDWMITDQMVAPKAYAMHSLFLLGNQYDWIHPELAIILERDFQIQSAGYKARARHILKKIKH